QTKQLAVDAPAGSARGRPDRPLSDRLPHSVGSWGGSFRIRKECRAARFRARRLRGTRPGTGHAEPADALAAGLSVGAVDGQRRGFNRPAHASAPPLSLLGPDDLAG